MVKPDTDERKLAMFKDNKLRLLMTLVGFMRMGDDEDADASWIIPSTLQSEHLLESVKLIGGFEFAPPTYEDNKSAEDFVRSKAAAARRQRAAFDDDTEGSGSDGEEDFAFPAGGPTARKADHEGAEPKKKRRLKRKRDEIDDEEREKRKKAREQTQKEKMRKIKSALTIDSDDDLTDEERDNAFYAREAEQRKRTQADILKVLTAGQVNSRASKKSRSTNEGDGSGKMATTVLLSDDSDTDTDDEEEQTFQSRVARQSSPAGSEDDSHGDKDNEMTDTPISSPHGGNALDELSTNPDSSQSSALSLQADKMQSMAAGDSDEDDDVPVRPTQRRRPARGGFLIDSDSE